MEDYFFKNMNFRENYTFLLCASAAQGYAFSLFERKSIKKKQTNLQFDRFCAPSFVAIDLFYTQKQDSSLSDFIFLQRL